MRLQRTTKSTKAFTRMRSTSAPEMSAGVMTANMPWKSMKAVWGMVGARSFWTSAPTPRRTNQCGPPRNQSNAPVEKDRL